MTDKIVKAGFGILIMNDKNQILFGKRNDDPIKADSALRGEGSWCIPGGKMDYGETFEEGIIREAYEETGIKVKKPEVIGVNNDKNKFAHFVTVALLAKEWEGEPKVMEPDEITEWKWFDQDNLPEKIFPPSKKILDNHLAKKFYLPEKNQEDIYAPE